MNTKVISYGSLIGIATVAYFSAIFFFKKDILFEASVQGFALVFYVFFMFLAAKSDLTRDFKTMLRLAFATFIVGNIFYYIFDFTLFNYIDKSLEGLYKDKMFEAYKAAFKSIEEQNQLYDDIQATAYHTFQTSAFRFAKGAIGGFGLAVLVAMLTKRFFPIETNVK